MRVRWSCIRTRTSKGSSPCSRELALPLCPIRTPGPLHARVRELIAAGINVSLGQDDISDAYYAFGRNNMLEVAFLGAHLLWMMSETDMDLLYDAITVNPAAAIGLDAHRLAVGCEANLVVVEGETVADALRFHAAPRAVVSHGRLVDRDAMRASADVPA